ncbi:hypothetical protein [Caulobacter sp. DWP3-1-3b2]|uniref:hypothetical protein n=1 Tax=Caulobacter sp. DWP3-1-3b2 TaxID=2804643 RepID=UPI003CEC6DD0
MAIRKTTIVLGAGSSVGFKLPAGPALGATIAAMVTFIYEEGYKRSKGDAGIHDYFVAQGNSEAQKLWAAAARVAEGLPYSLSIDDFLYKHGHDPQMIKTGKLAIARAILNAERSSILKHIEARERLVQDAALGSAGGSWLNQLLILLQSNLQKTRIADVFNGLTIINFNYDRCVEYYVFHAMQRAFRIDSDQASSLMKNLHIIHPYGKVGALPWEGTAIPFGQSIGGMELGRISEQILTFTEQSHDEEDLREIQKAIQQCEMLLFLGFAFHPQNMQLLDGPGPHQSKRIFGTAFRESGFTRDVFVSRVTSLVGLERIDGVANLFDMDCDTFMSNFGLAILA